MEGEVSREGEEIAAHKGAGIDQLPVDLRGNGAIAVRRRGREQGLQYKEHPRNRIPEFGKRAQGVHGRSLTRRDVRSDSQARSILEALDSGCYFVCPKPHFVGVRGNLSRNYISSSGPICPEST